MMDLSDKTILVTSGPSYAFIDDVRVIANRSSGRLGSQIALTLAKAGAQVIQLAGENSTTAATLDENTTVQVKHFSTVENLQVQMKELLINQNPDAVLMAAAVLDYIPAERNAGKMRSDRDEWTVRFKRGEKIIENIRRWYPTLLVGFKLESGISLNELIIRAQDLMRRSGAELVMANLLEDVNEHNHTGYLIEENVKNENELQRMNTREEIATDLTSWLNNRLHQQER